MTNPVCPETGAPMYRGVRPMILTYKGKSLTFDMPGWYCDQSEESIHTGEDMKISDRKLNLLKARCEGVLEPEKIRLIRQIRFFGFFGLFCFRSFLIQAEN